MGKFKLFMAASLLVAPSIAFADPATSQSNPNNPQTYNGPITSTKDVPETRDPGTIQNTGSGSCVVNSDGSETCNR